MLLQIAVGVRVLRRVGLGLTTTVTLGVLEQLCAVVTELETTETGAEVVLISVSFGLLVCATVTAALLIPATAARVQVNVAPAVAEVGL